MATPPQIPNPPEFSEELRKSCQESGDFLPMLFEWYKFVAVICNFFARLRPDSPALRKLEPIHYSVCSGLLNRCSRLMLSNVALSHKGKFGETTAIIDRSIFESCVKLSWLCQNADPNFFERYLADGLKSELELKSEIEKAIEVREGQVLVIEARMLASIQRHIESSTLSEAQIRAAKKLPDLAAMLETLGRSRLMYVVGQKIGSHHVHGTWPSLKQHYLELTPEGHWAPRDHDCSTHRNQYIYISLAVLDALRSFIDYCIEEPREVDDFIGLFDSIEEEIMKIMKAGDGNDFDPAPAT
ncbi:DUF5677 domain-containing protein [Geothrix sp. SG200]|uniref:DUF5677 domain-containing protein n=1 Tax=Geothrix sp. SG200 TaxID=2922865 RepID=UPI001FAC9F9E|nr:DUF5677 domain-containing protein [Geothrix sp. SG200]